MKSLALECPVPFMGDLLPLTDFDFILAHLWRTIPGYTEWYLDQRKNGRTIVLDNGTNELGEPVSLQEMDKVVCELNPDYIVPPDYLGEGKKTIQSLKEGICVWGRERLIPVVQGSTASEVLVSYSLIRGLGFETVSVPYDICVEDRSTPLKILASTRMYHISQMLATEGEEIGKKPVQLHLLGLNTLEEIDHYRKSVPEVVSIDTGAPFLNASLGVKFGLGEELVRKGIYIDYHKPRELYSSGTVELAQYNVKYLKGLVNDAEN